MKKLFSDDKQRATRNFSQIAKTVQIVKSVSNRVRFSDAGGIFGGNAGYIQKLHADYHKNYLLKL